MKKLISLFILICLTLGGLVSLHADNAVVQPHVLVIFGGAGDLTQRKLIPAVYSLYEEGLLPDDFACVAVGRDELSTADYRELVARAIDGHPADFLKHFHYFKADFNDDSAYDSLNRFLVELDERQRTHGNRLYYLATPPSVFSTVIQKLSEHRLINKSGPWTRVVIEKPFGRDLESAEALQKVVSRYLTESQIYRIDHYLGKAAVKKILPVRLEYPALEKKWNHDWIDHVDITLSEQIGVGTRGYFWEQTGMLRDVVQNHMMEMLALVAMELPSKMVAKDIRPRRADALKATSISSLKSVVRGQYGPGVINGKSVPGYRQEQNVDPKSTVETFVAATIFVNSPRWQDVPFHIRAGKRLDRSVAEVVISFKDSSQLVIRVQPNPEIFLIAQGQRTTLSDGLSAMPEAYEQLLHDCMVGDQELFVGIAELLASWRLFTPLLQYWEQHPPTNFPNYPAGSAGAKQTEQ